MMKMKNNNLLSTTEAAKLLNVHPSTVTTLLRQGKLNGTKINPRVWVVYDDETFKNYNKQETSHENNKF